jgi:uncharacterized cupredoxin-like copper-binding protein
MSNRSLLAAGLAVAFASGGAFGHGGHLGAHAFGASGDPRAVTFGRPGDPAKVSRAIAVEMDDRECRLQKEVRIRQGDTLRFDVRNRGSRMHEFVLGTSHELKEHAAGATDSPKTEHDEPYIVHVEPGTRGSLVWRFTRVDLLGYGCLIHGSGRTAMTGRILVER